MCHVVDSLDISMQVWVYIHELQNSLMEKCNMVCNFLKSFDICRMSSDRPNIHASSCLIVSPPLHSLNPEASTLYTYRNLPAGRKDFCGTAEDDDDARLHHPPLPAASER